MFVCICNGHRDKDIQDAARAGMTCARKIYRSLGKPVRCGRCLDLATQLVDEVHATTAGHAAGPVGACATAPAPRRNETAVA